MSGTRYLHACAVIAGLATPGVSRAGDSTEAELSTIRASVEVREAATFPVGLLYDCARGEIDGGLLRVSGGGAWESVWFDFGAQVYRRVEYSKSGPQEVVNAWDGENFLWANRIVGSEEWSGTHQAKWDSWIASSILWSQFFYGRSPISKVLDSSTATVLGETHVDGVRCIAVSVKTSDAHPTIFELDPVFDYFPRRVSVVFPSTVRTPIVDGARLVRFPGTGESRLGRPVSGGELYVITCWEFQDVRRIGEFAVVSHRVETRNERSDRPRRRYELRSSEVSESVVRGDPLTLLGGRGQLVGVAGDHWKFGAGTSDADISGRVLARATEFGREFGTTEPGVRAADSRSETWVLIGAAVGVAVGALLYLRVTSARRGVDARVER